MSMHWLRNTERILQQGDFMRIDSKRQDIIFLILLIFIFVGLPFGIKAYDRHLEPGKILSGAKEFTLTGHAQKGWLLENVVVDGGLTIP